MFYIWIEDCVYVYRFLNDFNKSVDFRRWGIEGLAYLILDVEVKEEFINDISVLRLLIDVVVVSMFLEVYWLWFL